jgi:HEAT repeat protein
MMSSAGTTGNLDLTGATNIAAYVCSPAVTDEQAYEVVKSAYERDPAIDVQLLAFARSDAMEWLHRVLRLLGRISSGTRLVASLLPLLNSEDEQIRAQAALLIARGRPNTAWALEMLKDPNPRVRANVVEGSEGWCRSREFLEQAMHDRHHRVVCNAIVNLYSLAPKRARSALEMVAERSDPLFRAAAAWACGAIGSPELSDLAVRLRSDPHPSVRWNALRAIRALHKSTVQSSDTPASQEAS